MFTIEQIKDRIELHDLAERLGWKRPAARGNYHSPHHPDKNPSISIFNNGTRWKDFSSGAAGTCIDMVMFHFDFEFEQAVDWLREQFNMPAPVRGDAPKGAPDKRLSRAEYIAEKSLADREPGIQYLVQQRGIPEATAREAAKLGTIGWNTYTGEDKKTGKPIPPGEFGHGGPALACICRTLNPGHVAAVELRYADPDLNGGVKTMTQGVKDGAPFFMNPRAFAKARRVVIVESPINAISVEACRMPGTVAMATRGTQTLDALDFSILKGKEVLIAMDPDPAITEGPKKGTSPGIEAGWTLYDKLVGLGISAMLVDQDEWEDGQDINDVLKARGPDDLRTRLKKLAAWAIPGQPGKLEFQRGRPRVYLPAHDWRVYGNFRITPDFTTMMQLNKEGEPSFHDVAGFRIAAMSRVTIQSAQATLTGTDDLAPDTQFSVSVQTPRHGAKLQRRVMTDDQVHSKNVWEKFGPIYNPKGLSRLVNIWERAAHIGQVHAANLVGLCWKQGRLVVNEGPDTYFRHPHQQCPYHLTLFPRGGQTEARRVIMAFRDTFSNCAGLQLLTWALGGHLKAFMEYWPHMVLQAEKGAGKTTLARRLERAIGMRVFGGETMGTRFRMLCSVSGTFHPVGWEELSAHGMRAIEDAQSLLQDAYQSNVSQRNSDLAEFVTCAPVLLVGEDVPLDSLIGKTCRTYLDKQGSLLPADLPAFPVREWLEFLSRQKKERIREIYADAHGWLVSQCMAKTDDGGARRMLTNYAAVATSWYLICEFAELDTDTGDFLRCLAGAMNSHISETRARREPWVWIMETALSEMAAGRFQHPYAIDTLMDGELCLILRPSHILDHIKHSPGMRSTWDALPVKSALPFKKQLERAGVIENDGVEKRIREKRYGHMTALSVERLEKFGLLVPVDSRGPDYD